MTKILVTGGTGVLGREIVRQLSTRADVRVLSRSSEGPRIVRGDLETGAGLAAALEGVDVIVHAASNGSDRRRPDRDMAPANSTGERTFADDLRERLTRDGRVAEPYDLRSR